MNRFLLRYSLRKQSAKDAEAAELTKIAEGISRLDIPGLDNAAKDRIAHENGFRHHAHRRALMLGWQGAVAFVVVTILVVSQSSVPGSALYPIKQGTEKVRSVLPDNVPLLPDKHHGGNNREDRSGHGRGRGGDRDKGRSREDDGRRDDSRRGGDDASRGSDDSSGSGKDGADSSGSRDSSGSSDSGGHGSDD